LLFLLLYYIMSSIFKSLLSSRRGSRKIHLSNELDPLSNYVSYDIRKKKQPTNPIGTPDELIEKINNNEKLLTEIEKDIKDITVNWDDTVKQTDEEDNLTRLNILQNKKAELQENIRLDKHTLSLFNGGKSKQKRKTKRTNRKRKTNKKSKRAARHKTSKNLL